MRLVVDCSAFLASVLPDESCPEPMRAAMRDADWIVPALWPAEVGNALVGAERRKRIRDIDTATIFRELRRRSLEIEASALEPVLDAALALARVHALSVYDATYLELAQRRGLPLATLDNDLIKAAKKAKVELV